ncbi:Hint domain-containing protein [Nioella sp. MMSF_3534]|uniref:Hint domain-containing protein n=1 Tax=Nioella sp. MMSF_3534 TaxID=3046720 RepID=UPI00273F533F|nr:Hint domain-containing protein [Nioella sp. MMSF_3534]
MAAYSVTVRERYDELSGASTNPNYNITLLIEDDGTFTSGEPVTHSPGGGGDSFTYVGTYDDGTTVWGVLQESSGDYMLFSGDASATPPGSIVIANITTDPLLACFHAGTLIDTPNGATAVESLSRGDRVLTSDGKACSVKWIGRQTISTRFGPAERLMPVRFAAGSLGDGLPQADLTVTADHGMLLDGVICHAGALVNGTTITHVPLTKMGETYTVYHIETEAHEIILANGALAETFIDNVNRRVFDNFSEFEALYGDVPEMEELPFPRAMSARQIPIRIRDALLDRGNGKLVKLGSYPTG